MRVSQEVLLVELTTARDLIQRWVDKFTEYTPRFPFPPEDKIMLAQAAGDLEVCASKCEALAEKLELIE